MGSVASNQADVERPTVSGVTALHGIARRIARLSSFDFDAVSASPDWPYLWKKSTPAVVASDQLVSKDAVFPVRSTNELDHANEALAAGRRVSARTIVNAQLAKTLLWGVVSLVMYLAILTNQATVTKYYTGGGVFAFVVVATALAFALVHGTFASRILEGLLFRAANRDKNGGGH